MNSNLKLVILDRDGTINRVGDEFLKSPDDWQALPGALEAISRLNHAGFHVVLATNESGLGRGLFDMSAFNAMHSQLMKKLAAVGGRVDAFFYCPHAADEGCGCRKPWPGLFAQISERYGVSLNGVPCIGNSLSDMQVAEVVGCVPHLVVGERHPEWWGQTLPEAFPVNTQVHRDLAACVDHLLGAHVP
jgi:D-glycero-D-manno-heptose 1,7-bisphosphate phosphatase